MKYLTSSELRQLWRQFWLEHRHYELPSHNLLNPDASLLWINSGIAGIKDYFLGRKIPPAPRLFNIQKAVRTNDLNNIGHTNRHLSFFEMMGNFALNDYQKSEAIQWAWEFLVDKRYLAFDENKLYVTYYEKDVESYKILTEKLKIPATHLIPMSHETNFWDLGVGPCGPNLEIFYDLGSRFDPQKQGVQMLKANKENDRYLEIWNIVFSEFLNPGNNQYQKLPSKNIDTGAGLERLMTILQQKNNCFETDIFQNSLKKLEVLATQKYLPQLNFELTADQQQCNYQFKVILDHLRTATFLISDLLSAQQPIDFHTRHGYIIRKLIRIAILQFTFLHRSQPFLTALLPAIISDMVSFYPELKTHSATIEKIFVEEEAKFFKLLQHKSAQNFIAHSPTKITGKTIFELVSSVGIPLEFIQKIAHDQKIILDLENFQILWKEHQKNSQLTKHQFVKDWKILELPTAAPTIFNENKFLLANVQVLGLFVAGKKVDMVQNNVCWMICNTTPFYAEKGGQIYDIGSFQTVNAHGKVINVQINHKNQVLHRVEVVGKLKISDLVTLNIDVPRRHLVCNNHSATHLLHSALRHEISPEIHQTGSFNNDQYFRLDFNSPRKLLSEDLIVLENKVNQLILQKIKPEIIWTSLEEAKKNRTLAFFEEFYNPEKVRIVKFGDYSAELCGGTHVASTQNIERFLITRFESISQGNYRIYALTTKQKCHVALQNLQTEFHNWTKKNHLSPVIITQNNDLQKLYKQIVGVSQSLLTLQTNINIFKKVWKQFYATMQANKLQKTLANYLIEETAYSQFKKKRFFFHVIHDPNHLGEDLLWKLFDKVQKEAPHFICLLLPLQENLFRFVLSDRLVDFRRDWKELIKEKFHNSHNQIGGPPNKLQGKITILNIKNFQNWLKNCFLQNC